MSSKLKVSIPDPCTQIWDEMMATSTGKYCSQCEKEIIDFTKMSTVEMENWFLSSKGNICGRINKTQLEFFNQPLQPKNKTGGLLYKLLMASCLTFIANLKTSASIVIQDTIKVDTKIKQSQEHVSLVKPDSLVKISGIIKDRNDKLPVQAVAVSIKNSNITTFTDNEGSFTIEVPSGKDEVTIVCNFIGYVRLEKKVLLTSPNVELMMDIDPVLLGEVVVVNRKYQNFFLNFGSIVYRKVKGIFR